VWYKNIAGRFFGLVTKQACDRRTDRQTDRITAPKTVLSIARTVKIQLYLLQQVYILVAVCQYAVWQC